MDEFLLPALCSAAPDFSFYPQSSPLFMNTAYHDSLHTEPLFTSIAPLPVLPSPAPDFNFDLELSLPPQTTINYSYPPISTTKQPELELELEQPLSSKNIFSSPETDADEAWEPADIHRIGYRDVASNWRCAFAGCQSSRIFVRACDLRKHFRGHEKVFFCERKECQGAGVGFASRKDYQRHMRSHQPAIECPHTGCERVFSRKDNMVSGRYLCLVYSGHVVTDNRRSITRRFIYG